MAPNNDNQKEFTVKEAFSAEYDPKPEPETATPQNVPSTLLERLQQGLKAKGKDPDLSITIYEGKSLIYKSNAQQQPSKNILTQEQTALLQKALENPQGVVGSIRIYAGQEKIFHVRNGEILADTLNLAKVQQQARTSQKEQETVSTSNLSLDQRIETLQKQVEHQQQQIDLLSRQLERLSRSTPQVAYAGLSKWFQNSYAQVQQKGKNLYEQLSESLQNQKEKLVSQVREFVTQKKEQVAEGKENFLTQVEASRNTIQIKTGEFVLSAMDKAARKTAELTGTKATLTVGSAVNPQSKWDLYSDRANYFHSQITDKPLIPAQLTVATAQYALQDGIGKREVLQMLTTDPEYRRLEATQGQDKAQQYAGLALAQATRLQVQGKQPQLQTEQQQSSQRKQDKEQEF